MALLAYDLRPDGTATFREVLVDYYPEDGDGLVVDAEGNLYVAVRDVTRPGIVVYAPSGEELAYIPTPVVPMWRLVAARKARRSTSPTVGVRRRKTPVSWPR